MNNHLKLHEIRKKNQHDVKRMKNDQKKPEKQHIKL